MSSNNVDVAAVNGNPGRRISISKLQQMHDEGEEKPLDDLVRAWKGIKEKKADDPLSFFHIGGIHGLPFTDRPAVDALSDQDRYSYWGGWCNHGNVLFPTWHRAYLLYLEHALQSVVPGVMLPFWDETDDDSIRNGIPTILTQEKYRLDGVVIDNPLRSFKFPVAVGNPTENNMYTKPAGYETVRYPLSGLVGTVQAKQDSDKHNLPYREHKIATDLLNTNVVAFLQHGRTTGLFKSASSTPPYGMSSTTAKFAQSLLAPNYTVFSNTTSAQFWNSQHPDKLTQSLEAPHNDIHLAVGGYDIGSSHSGLIRGANGDMGANEVAGFDPIFYFHHCNIDRIFALWQLNHGATLELTIEENYPGTNNALDGQGPTPETAIGTQLNMKSLLKPFRKPKTNLPTPPSAGSAPSSPSVEAVEPVVYYTSEDMVNILDLGYYYWGGSTPILPVRTVPHAAVNMLATVTHQKRVLKVSGVDRAYISGSFVIRAMVRNHLSEGDHHVVGVHTVLSRGDVTRCANCMTHVTVGNVFSLEGFETHEDKDFFVEIDALGSINGKLEYDVEIIKV